MEGSAPPRAVVTESITRFSVTRPALVEGRTSLCDVATESITRSVPCSTSHSGSLCVSSTLDSAGLDFVSFVSTSFDLVRLDSIGLRATLTVDLVLRSFSDVTRVCAPPARDPLAQVCAPPARDPLARVRLDCELTVDAAVLLDDRVTRVVVSPIDFCP